MSDEEYLKLKESIKDLFQECSNTNFRFSCLFNDMSELKQDIIELQSDLLKLKNEVNRYEFKN